MTLVPPAGKRLHLVKTGPRVQSCRGAFPARATPSGSSYFYLSVETGNHCATWGCTSLNVMPPLSVLCNVMRFCVFVCVCVFFVFFGRIEAMRKAPAFLSLVFVFVMATLGFDIFLKRAEKTFYGSIWWLCL